jgi:acetyl-CoA synthetase
MPNLHAHEIPLSFPPIGEGACTLEEYKEKYAFSIQDPSAFWAKEAERLTWYHPFDSASVLQGSFENGDVAWFAGGKLNVCYNAVDRHVVEGHGGDLAMVWEGDEPNDIRKITYSQLQQKTSQIAHALAVSGIKRGDVVTVYMPMSKYEYTVKFLLLFGPSA